MLSIDSARDWYPDDDPIHGFDHILRVYRLVEIIAESEKADLEIVRAAALLHDSRGYWRPGSDAVSDQRVQHQIMSSEFAHNILRKEGWSEERIDAVQHCIRAHRYRDNTERPQTLEAKVLFDADKLDAIGAVGVVRAIAFAVSADQRLFAQPSEQFKMTGVKEPNEPHTPYHEFLFKLRYLKDLLFTPTAKKIAVKRHRFLELFFEQLITEMNVDSIQEDDQ